MMPNEATQNAYSKVATRKGVGSPASRTPNIVYNMMRSTTVSANATAMKARTFPSRNSNAEMLET